MIEKEMLKNFFLKVDYTPESGNMVDFKPARPVINRFSNFTFQSQKI